MNVQYECPCGAQLTIDLDGLGSVEERGMTQELTTVFIDAHKGHAQVAE